MAKYKIGQLVICNGLIGIVESISTIAGTELPLYSLIARDDKELSCSVGEEEIEEYIDEIDQKEAMSDAHFSSFMTMKMVDNLTDKYYGDE